MITLYSILDLSFGPKVLKVLQVLGLTVVFQQNEKGEWYKMDTIIPPVLSVALCLLIVAGSFFGGIVYVIFIEGKFYVIYKNSILLEN